MVCDLFVAPCAPSTYSLGKERVLARLGWAGVIGYACGFFEPVASHLPHLLFLDEGLLGQTPSRSQSCSRLSRSNSNHMSCIGCHTYVHRLLDTSMPRSPP